jgi:hypothetical protein|tara:strand:- start:1084 stop:1494 length:411 start_codon:yes stop_codon:yes gene_type:complete
MRLALALTLLASSAIAESSSLALTLPNPPMNYQSDTFSSGNLRCSNAVGGATSLEFGVMGNINNVGRSFSTTNAGQSKDIGVYTRIVIPLDKPRSRINCDDLYKVELTQRKLEIQMLRNELEALKDLQKGGMEFEN